LISSDPWENRVALLEDGKLSEIYYEREERVIGSIYKGKVQNVLQGMGAGFIDIGLGRNAFLYVDDINKAPLNIGDVEITQGRSGYTIGEKVERGDEVLLQIVKEPRGLKGARVSTNISLPGRYLILMPTGKFSGVSRKIESAEERNRLKATMKLIRPDGMATVVRTAAAGVSQAELIADLGVLIRMWHGILESYKRAPAPALIHKDMNLIYKAARDFITPEVRRVLIDDRAECEKVKDFMRLLGPQYVERIEYYEGGRALFADFKVDEEVQRLMRPKAELPSGGSIVIESTEALTVIDVNSGKFTGGRNLEDTIVRTNIEAAAEIARQVRLRDIGGIVVCDFIDMNTEASRTKVIETLKQGLQRDRTRTTIQSFSSLGLLEFTRKRIGKDLSGQLRGACPTCRGLGSLMSPESMAIEAMREVRRAVHTHQNGTHPSQLEVHAAPTVAASLEFWHEDEVLELERELEIKLAVKVDATLHPERLRVGTADSLAKAAVRPEALRVGDEFEVEILSAKLPTATSGLAVVAGRLIEIENGAGAVGRTIRIRILDVAEDGAVLAESRAPVASGEEEQQRRRRRRGGRGRSKPITPDEQTEELLALAEEAAKVAIPSAPIGISTATELEDVEKRLRVIPGGGVRRPFVPLPAAQVAEIGSETDAGAVPGETAEGRHRRRRRRRGRPGVPIGPMTVGTTAMAAPPESFTDDSLIGIPPASAVVQSAELLLPNVVQTGRLGAPETEAESGVREGVFPRRRRRRRRRGRGGVPGTDAVPAPGSPELQVVPERHIFRAGVRGVERTGEMAPPEPVRAIARVINRPGHVAVEPPPPSLKLVEEVPKIAKPTRGRPPNASRTVRPFIPIAALPPAPVDEKPAPRPRGRPRKVVAVPDASAAIPVKAKAAPAVTRRTGSSVIVTRKSAVVESSSKSAKTTKSATPAKGTTTTAARTPKLINVPKRVAAQPKAAPAVRKKAEVATAAGRRLTSTAGGAQKKASAAKKTTTKASATKVTTRKKS
jgi:ribonuclease G